MISEALNAIVKLINATKWPAQTPAPLIFDNISRVNDSSTFTSDLQDKLVMSIVNIEEERIAKTQDNYFIQNNKVQYRNPPYHLNFTLLFSATHKYETALPLLEDVLLFFQKKNVFTPENTPELMTAAPEVEMMIFDMMNINLEQVHQLWSTLGGHYMPSFIFKLRMLTVLDKSVNQTAEPITSINIDEVRIN